MRFRIQIRRLVISAQMSDASLHHNIYGAGLGHTLVGASSSIYPRVAALRLSLDGQADLVRVEMRNCIHRVRRRLLESGVL